MIVFHPRLIYPFQSADRVLAGFTRNELQGSDGAAISVQERAGTGPVVLYFMGNAGALPFFEGAFEAHIATDRHVIALEYRPMIACADCWQRVRGCLRAFCRSSKAGIRWTRRNEWMRRSCCCTALMTS